MKEIVETVKLDSFKEEAPVQEEKKTEAIKPVKKEIKEPKAVSEKPRQPKPVKERAAKEKQPREFREPKEKQVREKTTKPVKPVEILTDPEEIKEVENRAKVFLRDVFASMNLGEVEIHLNITQRTEVWKLTLKAKIWESLSAREARLWILFSI